MRQTAKFKAARALVLKLFAGDKTKQNSYLKMDHETLYECFHDLGYVWEHKQSAWEKVSSEDRQFMGGYASMFTSADGSPSGLVNVRVMANPADLDAIRSVLERVFVVGRVSEPIPNRGGDGVRVYFNARLPEPKKSRSKRA